MMKFTVIIPTYNRLEFLKRSVNSVFNQTYKDLELIVVNDGSTDETSEYINSITDPRVKLIEQANSGVSSARNTGIKAATTEWIAFLDSDDEWLPNKLEVQSKFITENSNPNFIHSNEIWNRNGKRVNPPLRFDKSNNEIFKRSLEMCLISPSTVVAKKDLLLKHGLFDESLEICEDFDLWNKILANEDVGFISDHLIIKYGGHEDQLSTKYPAMDYWRIKSLVKLYHSDLSEENKVLVKNEVLKKTDLLLKGYSKHGHTEKYEEIRGLISRL